jgi:hypothetical protein
MSSFASSADGALAAALTAVVLLLAWPAAAGAYEAEADSDDGAAQEPSDTTMIDSTEVDPVTVDTLRFAPELVLDNAAPVTDSTNYELYRYQNPTLALFKSMAVPGWGQAGNRAYVKAVLFFGLDAFFIASAIHHGRKASDFRSQYEAAGEIAERNRYYDLYDDRRTNRNKFTWYAVITTFIAMFDAYVDAHLSGFPSEQNREGVGIELVPYSEGRTGIALSIRF